MPYADSEKARAYNLAYKDANRERMRAYDRAHPQRRSLRGHNISASDRHEMWEKQGRACYLCRRPIEEHGRGAAHIDHDHDCCPGNRKSCGRCIRGLACQDCNVHLIPLIDKGHPIVGHLSVFLAKAAEGIHANESE